MRELRLRAGWTQDDLAVKLQLYGWDTSRESVSRLETQDRRVADLELFVIANIFGLTTDELFPAGLNKVAKKYASFYRAKLSRGQVPPI